MTDQYLNTIHKKLDKIFKRVGAKNIRIEKNNLHADIYGFVYEFKTQDVESEIAVFRSDGNCNIITQRHINFCNNITMPFLEYVTKTGSEREAQYEKSMDPSVVIHLLMPGDYYISYERCFAENTYCHKSAELHIVEND